MSIILPQNNGVSAQQPLAPLATQSLKKIYLEPTTICNINCKTCLRNSWTEEKSHMKADTFEMLIKQVEETPSIREASIWGIGEPLSHPDIAGMIERFHKLRIKTELISNGMLLDENKARRLVESGLDTLIISADSTNDGQFANIRRGSSLKRVLKNVQALNRIKRALKCLTPEMGLEFTLMKSNMHELKNLRELAYRLEASFIVVSNLLPYTEAQKDEILYWSSASGMERQKRSVNSPEILLPKIDLQPDYYEPLGKIALETLAYGPDSVLGKNYRGVCPYAYRGALAVGYKGDVSPCVPLLHSYTCYILGREKQVQKHYFGNIHQQSIQEIWDQQVYKKFRNTLLTGGFSPCVECSGGCNLADSNQEDCYGNTAPTCGDCLWAKGVIQCP